MAVYKTKGVCSRSIEFEIEGDVVKSVKFNGGCNGNTQGIASLVQGIDVYKRQFYHIRINRSLY